MKEQKGFSLVEMVGVLAIIAIILSAATPSIINHIKNANYDTEADVSQEIADALVNYIQETRLIPNEDVWADSLAGYAAMSPTQLTTTKAGTRRLIVHPGFVVENFPSSQYNQDSLFKSNDSLTTTQPTNARMMLISNVRAALPTTTLNSAQFDNVWSQTGTIPTGFSDNDSLVIERISLGALFYPVTMNVASGPVSWAVNSTATADAASYPTVPKTYYVLKNSHIYTRDVAGGPITSDFLVNQGLTIGSAVVYGGGSSGAGSSGGASSGAGGSSSSAGGAFCSGIPAWNVAVNYANNVLVYDPATNWIYKSTRANNLGSPPAANLQWAYNFATCS